LEVGEVKTKRIGLRFCFGGKGEGRTREWRGGGGVYRTHPLTPPLGKRMVKGA